MPRSPGQDRDSGSRGIPGLGAVAIALAGALILAACEAPIRVRGHAPEPESIESIKAGLYTQDDIIALLGTPSTVSTFDDRKWYYIGHKSKQVAYLEPEVLERQVLVVSFDETGYVSETRLYTLEDGRDIEPVGRITPTEGRDFTILQQILGNIGRLPGSSGQPVTLPGP